MDDKPRKCAFCSRPLLESRLAQTRYCSDQCSNGASRIRVGKKWEMVREMWRSHNENLKVVYPALAAKYGKGPACKP